MWLLEHEGDALQSKRLWLRPGKRYLFGRTVAETGMLAIHGEKSNSVSRKHITIEVDPVRSGDSQNLLSRSKVTVEDLKSKLGTTINGNKIKGEKHVVDQKTNELKLGSMSGFRITWFPVVLSFSFTRKELDAGAQTKLQDNFEQLDIKLLTDYAPGLTTHVVNKKRNTSKGLQALVNGVYIVDDGFLNTMLAAARPIALGDGVDRSALEGDFDNNWPDALQFLPPPGKEPVQRPVEAFAPNPARREMFEGYTFIFYDAKQHESLIGPITDGKGKALYTEVIHQETQIDDFVRYVKSVAGEKGLGELEDGSDGKGVVVVRYVPAEPWYEQFYTAVSLRLDHRLVDQKDFLDAILGCDASGLRRRLEVESPSATQQEPTSSTDQHMEVDTEQAPAPSQVTQPRRPFRTARKRFKGFVADSDSDGGEGGDAAMVDTPPVVTSQSADAQESAEEGLFVSQYEPSQVSDVPNDSVQQSQRKRPAADSFEEDFAPTAAMLKRRRIAAGEDHVPRRVSSEPEQSVQGNNKSNNKKAANGKSPKIKKEFDVLEAARQHREELEAKARAEREDLEVDAEGLDLAEIRRLHIEEPMKLRTDIETTRTREQDVADGRWDPAWNGRKNFKRFRQRGAVEAARPIPRIIVALEEVKTRTGGIGDDYWLEDETTQRRKKKSQRESQSQATSSKESQRARGRRTSTASASGRPATNGGTISDVEEDAAMDDSTANKLTGDNAQGNEDEDEDELVFSASSRRRGTRGSSIQQESSSRSLRTTQTSQPSRSTGKRAAAAPPAREQPAKKPRRAAVPASDDDDDESEEELRFKFKRR